jgi:sulfur relay (sulfurtransferase) DsrF/TusC family protein
LNLRLSILFILVTMSLYAQKRLTQTYDATAIKELYIHSNEIFKIKITTGEVREITVATIIDGETFASTLLNTFTNDGVLKITTGKTPDYIPFNDKLAAHKVLAIELEIIIPIGLDVSIYSTLASVDTYGKLGQVRIDLGRGHFKGEEFRFRESGKINTISGSIYISSNLVNVTAQSRNGKVDIPPTQAEGPLLAIKSIHGDVTVVKSL